MQLKRILFVLLSALIVTLFLVTRLYDFPNRYSFDYDQQDGANAAWHIIVDKKPILIGQQTSVGGLFVGPALYWFESIAMYFGQLNPLSLGYLGVFVSLVTLTALFLLVCEISNKWQGLIAAFLYAISARLTSYDISGNAITYMMLFSLLIFWILYKIIAKKQYNLLPLLALFLALTFHIHLALSLLLLPTLLILLWKRPKIQIKYVLLSVFTFMLPLLTFALFELRHQFLITHNLLNFLSMTRTFSLIRTSQALKTFIVILIESAFIQTKYSIWLFIIVILIYIYLTIKSKNNSLLVIVLLLIPLPLSLFYNGQIPEYYFLPAAPIFIIIASYVYFYLAKKLKLAFILAIATVIFFNIAVIKIFNVGRGPAPFALKEHVVKSIIDDTSSSSFNVYYQMPFGFNNGYQYLFKWHGRLPQEGGKNLYIVESPTFPKFDSTKYYQTFPQKKIFISQNGALYIVSVK